MNFLMSGFHQKRKARREMSSWMSEKQIPIRKPWAEYPVGTKAVGSMGGYWIKTNSGWKWCTGATFPTPGGDVYAIVLPETESEE